MHPRISGFDWQKALWKIVKNPAVEVTAAIVVVLISAWMVIQAEAFQRLPHFPVLFGHK